MPCSVLVWHSYLLWIAFFMSWMSVIHMFMLAFFLHMICMFLLYGFLFNIPVGSLHDYSSTSSHHGPGGADTNVCRADRHMSSQKQGVGRSLKVGLNQGSNTSESGRIFVWVSSLLPQENRLVAVRVFSWVNFHHLFWLWLYLSAICD